MWHLFGLFLDTRVKLAVTSPSRHFRERQRLGEKNAKTKTNRYAKKNSKKTYYGKNHITNNSDVLFQRTFKLLQTFLQVFSNIERAQTTTVFS